MKLVYFFIIFISFSICGKNIYAWTLDTAIKKPNHSLLLKQKSDLVTYTPNSSFHLSLRLVAPFFFFQYSFKIPNTNFGRSNVGNDSYKDSRLGIYLNNTLIEGFYKKYIGFSSTENGGNPGCNNCLIRNNLSSEENLFQIIYPFNRAFDLRSAISGANQQINTDFTYVIHLFANRLKIRDQEGLVQGGFEDNHPIFNGLREFELRQIGIGPGIGVSLNMGEYLYFSGVTSIGFGYQENNLVYSDFTKKLQEYGLNYNLRFTMGTHNPKYNIGIRSLIVSNFYDIGEEVSISSVNYEVRLYTAITF